MTRGAAAAGGSVPEHRLLRPARASCPLGATLASHLLALPPAPVLGTDHALPCSLTQRAPSPSGDPVEATRGGLRRGRSAAGTKG